MKKKIDRTNDVLVSLHCACRRVIFEAMGIGNMKRPGLFMFCWYLAAVFLTLSIRMVRQEVSGYSGFIFFLSLFLVVLLTLYGLSWGRFSKGTNSQEAENEK